MHEFIISGSLSEASILVSVEKIELLQSALAVYGANVTVLINIAEQATKQAIACAHEAKANGPTG